MKKILIAMKALIVEDEDVLSQVLGEKLKKLNYDVEIAEDGEKAIRMAKSSKPDIIMLDLMLPKVDGFEVLKEIRSDATLKFTPILVLSNLNEDENIKKALKMGANDYFVKSNHPINEIVEKIKAVMLNGSKR